MLNPRLEEKLNSLTDLPSVPVIISQLLNTLENQEVSAGTLSTIIEKDQALTAKVLKVANSPFYGFARKISTIDLAIVVMGLNSLKEIVLSLLIQKFFTKVKREVFDINQFWNYSIFCGASSRVLARKMGYKLAGEAFIAGLMHDIGILIIVEHFKSDFQKIKKLMANEDLNLTEAEYRILGTNHSDIGAWFAEKWNLPSKLCNSIRNHHIHFTKINQVAEVNTMSGYSGDILSEIGQPLTAIVSLSEWIATEMGYKNWRYGSKEEELYLSNEVFEGLNEHDILDEYSAFNLLKHEILLEYDKASVFSNI